MDENKLRSVALATLLPQEIETFFRPSGVSAALEEIFRLARARALMPIGVVREARLAALAEVEGKAESLLASLRDGESTKALTALKKLAGEHGWNDARQAIVELRARALQAVEEHTQLLEESIRASENEPVPGTVAYAVRQGELIAGVINRQRVGWPLQAIFR